MIAINKDEWVNPENIESLYVTDDGLQLFMVSGRVIQVIDNVGAIMRDIEVFFDKKMGLIVEPKPKRKYTKKKKESEEVETL